MDYLVKKYRENENFQLFLKLLFLLLMSRLLMLVLMVIYNLGAGTDRSVSFLMNQWDAKRYQFMIDNWYTFPLDTDPQANWAFFPLYVIICRFFKLITFGLIDTYWVGMLVSNVCIFIAAFTAVKYMQLIKNGGMRSGVNGSLNNGVNSGANSGCAGCAYSVSCNKDGSRLERISDAVRKDDGLLIALLMFAGPYSFYFGSVYTEALFVMFIVLFFYFAAKKRYLLAGFMAACASGTRIVGCLLVFALIVEMYMDFNNGEKISFQGIKTFIVKMFKEPARILSVMLCPLGTFAYMTFLKFFCGDPWAFRNVQIAWREDEYFPIVGVLWKACTGQIELRYTYMGWFCIAMFAVYGYMVYRKYYSLAAFGIIALLVPLSSHVMSTCRFTVGSYAVYIGVYDLLRNSNKKVRWIVLAFFAAAEIWLLFMWYNSDCWLM